MLKVSDTGCGMTAEMLAQIFEPFFTTKFLGRGLGLAAVSGIVRDHGGALCVESALGQGTCFQILFPPVDEKPTEVAQPVVDISSKFSGRVLLVDDEPELRESVEALLLHLGFQVELAEDGRQAIEKVFENKARYSLVLMDLMMPHLSGHEAFKVIQTQFPKLPVVLMSGYSDDVDERLFQDQRPTAFLHKPFSMHDLVQKILPIISTPV